jgi:hypothetical protein
MPNTRRTLSCTLVSITLLATFPHAAVAGPQQDRMRACNKEAKEKSLKGDERKSFMSSCLSSGKSEATRTADASDDAAARKKQCRAEASAKSLKGDERKTFMKQCWSGREMPPGTASAMETTVKP